MMYATPPLGADERATLDRIVALRDELAHQVASPRRWNGNLRRLTQARAVQASNSIEGINASIEDVVAAGDREAPLDAAAETYEALRGYQSAMTYVLQMSRAPLQPPIDATLIRSLHYMMTSYDLASNPGLWRPGAIWVERAPGGEVVYEGPAIEDVPGLIDEFVESIAEDHPVIVRGAMAHLNLAMIHPFSDGNGRMARCLQSLVLAQERIVEPVFASIEEYLGAHTQQYYDVLAEVGQGRWSPRRDVRPWLRFCLAAHEDQAARLLQRLRDTERLWELCAAQVARRRLPDRTIPALVDAARGFRLRNSSYRSLVKSSESIELTDHTASRDLKALVDAGLLEPRGERRGRIYVAAPELREIWSVVRDLRPALATIAQERLPGL